MKRILYGLVLGAAFFAVTPVYAAAYQYSTEVDNHITTGDISIMIEEFQLDESGETVPCTGIQTVVPNQTVSQIVRIVNEAEPAWIRAKAEFISDSGMTFPGDSMLGGISDLWVKCGAYYYSTRPVERREEIHFFEEIAVPSDWDGVRLGNGYSIDITAQAIQAANFHPAFETEDPWFGVPIEACVHAKHEGVPGGKNIQFAVVFENGTDGLIKIGNDFFENFSAIMPGDTLTDSFTVGNKGSMRIPVLFRTEVPEDQPAESRKALEELILTIQCNGEVRYAGPLRAETLSGGIVLAELDHDEIKQVTYSIHMPKELQNASAMQQAKVRWIFSTEYGTRSGGGSGGSSSDSGRGSSGSDGSRSLIFGKPLEWPVLQPVQEAAAEIMTALLPKTGDERGGAAAWLAVLFASGCGMLLMTAPW